MDITAVPTISGVYRIFNINTGKSYVGSSKNPQVRIKSHFRMLQNGRHHCAPLQEAYGPLGESAFSIAIEIVRPENLLLRERELLAEYRSKGLCYNTGDVKVTTKEGRKKRITGTSAIASYYLPAEVVEWIEKSAKADNRSPSNYLVTLIKSLPEYQP